MNSIRCTFLRCFLCMLSLTLLGNAARAEHGNVSGYGVDSVTLKVSLSADESKKAVSLVPVGDALRLEAVVTGVGANVDSINVSIYCDNALVQSSNLEQFTVNPYGASLPPGPHTFKVEVAVTVGSNTRVDKIDTKSITVVGIDKVILKGSDDDEGPLKCPMGQKVRLEAVGNPFGYFPEGYPVWTVESAPVGSTLNELADGAATVDVVPDLDGTYVVKARCGTSSDTITIEVGISKLKITKVEFTTDHGLLKDKNDTYDNGGSRFPNVEWEAASSTIAEKNYPFTHTWDTKVTLKVTIELEAGASDPGNIDIEGRGLGNFTLNNQASPAAGGTTTFTIEAKQKFHRIHKVIDIMEDTINWTIREAGTANTLFSQSTGPHKMYVTAGIPGQSQGMQITLKRIDRCITACEQLSDEAEIVDALWRDIGMSGDYSLVFGNPTPIWKVLDGDTAECIGLIHLFSESISMVGISPQGGAIVYIYANPGKTSHESTNPANHPQRSSLVGDNGHTATVGANHSTAIGSGGTPIAYEIMTFLDKNGGTNNWEACYRYRKDSGSAYKWYAGGTESPAFDSIQAVAVAVVRKSKWQYARPDLKSENCENPGPFPEHNWRP